MCSDFLAENTSRAAALKTDCSRDVCISLQFAEASVCKCTHVCAAMCGRGRVRERVCLHSRSRKRSCPHITAAVPVQCAYSHFLITLPGGLREGRGEQLAVTLVLRTSSGPVRQLKLDVCTLSASSNSYN